MSTTEPSGGAFLHFWKTLPGVLTAVAAVITAVTGLYVALGPGSSDGPAPEPSAEPRAEENLAGSSGSTPQASPDITPAQLDLVGLDQQVDAPVEGSAIDDCARGDSRACNLLMEGLVEECAAGFGLSCDVLYWVSPSGSDHEAFGATCGARFGWQVAGACGSM